MTVKIKVKEKRRPAREDDAYIQVSVSRKLHMELKLYLVKRDLTMQQFVTDLIIRELEKAKQ